jgi:hypothetical protein
LHDLDGTSVAALVATPKPASMALTLPALGIARGAVRRRKVRAEDDSQPLA